MILKESEEETEGRKGKKGGRYTVMQEQELNEERQQSQEDLCKRYLRRGKFDLKARS